MIYWLKMDSLLDATDRALDQLWAMYPHLSPDERDQVCKMLGDLNGRIARAERVRRGEAA